MELRKLLVANRGEIALRVMRTARAMGISTVAVYSEADVDAPHVTFADQAVLLGPAEVGASYLAMERILDAAKATGADAIHPGYGFLSENPEFVRACEETGLLFIGPPAEAMELMGNKQAARQAMEQAGVPCVPGYQGQEQDEERLLQEAERIGFPVLVKAAMGGGGRGMRLVTEANALPEALRAARAEAKNAFGDGTLLLERALFGARHVEVQIFADAHGNVLSLGERDCSVQRRYQKVIEESPSPAVDADLRARMGQTAVQAARACGYTNAGTVEFLLDQDGSYYFLEMNTRLQVEHPVTECVTGVDLVEWQLRVAMGEALPLTQEQVTLSGHAMEARLYAEDPTRDYLPQTGVLRRWSPPDLPGVRVDAGVKQGSVVGAFYDPMLAKIIVHAPTRARACRLMQRALRETLALGVTTNRALLSEVCGHPIFLQGEATTRFLTEHPIELKEGAASPILVAVSALLHFLLRADAATKDAGWIGWPDASQLYSVLKLEIGKETSLIQVKPASQGPEGRCYEISLQPKQDAAEESVSIEVIALSEGRLEARIDGVREKIDFATEGDTLFIDWAGQELTSVDRSAAPPETLANQGSGVLKAQMDGAIMEVFVSPGEAVEVGQTLLVMDAMKMEHPIKSDVHGIVKEVRVKAGVQVKNQQILVIVEPNTEGEG